MPTSENTITVDSAPPVARESPGKLLLGQFRFRYHRVVGEATWICVGQVVAVLGMLVGLRWLTALLSPLEFGRLALGMTIATLVQVVLVGPLVAAAQRFFATAVEANEFGAYMATMRRLFREVLMVIAGLSVIVVGLCLVTGSFGWVAIAVAACAFSAVAGGNSLIDGVQTAARRRVVVAVHQAASQWSRFLCAAVLVIFVSNTASMAMLGYAIGALVVLVPQWIFFRRTLAHLQLDSRTFASVAASPWRSDIIAYTWPFVTWGVFYWMHLASARWALEAFGTSSDVGYFAVLYQIGYYPLILVSGVMLQLICPIVFAKAGDTADPERMRDVRKLILRTAVLVSIATIVSYFLARESHDILFSWLVDVRFHSVSPLLPWVVLGGGFFVTAQVLSVTKMANTNTRPLIAPKIGTAVIGTILNFVGAWLDGVAGVVLANGAASFIYLAWMFALVWEGRHPEQGRVTC